MSQQIMPIVSLGVIDLSCCQNSVSVVLFADGTRSAGTEEVILDTKQAEKIYYIRNITDNDAGNGIASIQASSNSTTTDLANMFDSDIDTFGLYDADSSSGSVTYRFNFGSQAVRTLAMLYKVDITTLQSVKVRWAGSDLVFSSLVGVSESTELSEKDFSFGAQNLQYIEIEIISTNVNSNVTIHGIGEVGFSDMSSDLAIQVQNPITSNWLTAESLPTLNKVEEVLNASTQIQPNNNLTRIKLTNGIDWEGSVSAILVNPKFT